MPRVRLLKPGFVKGNAKVGSTHIVSQEEAELLKSDGAAVIDETETLQALQLESQQTELVALAEELTGQKAENAKLVAELSAKQTVIDDLTLELKKVGGQEALTEELKAMLEARDAELAELKSGGATPLPSSFPERDRLVEAGFVTIQSVQTADDAQLDAIEGIGEATIKKIRESLTALSS